MRIRVNLGGPDYIDRDGNSWGRDVPYRPGAWGCLNTPDTDILTTADPISGTQDPTLFQTARVGEELRYRFDLPNGRYSVKILFAEIYWESRDAELLEVYVQRKRVETEYSIYDDVGHDAAAERSYPAEATEGHLVLRIVGLSLPMHSGARACAVEVERIACENGDVA